MIGAFAALAGLNMATWACFARDKSVSKRGGRRIPEARLLMLAALGGWPAAKLAQRMLRHKTRKQPFAQRLNLIGIVWGVGIAWLVMLGPV